MPWESVPARAPVDRSRVAWLAGRIVHAVSCVVGGMLGAFTYGMAPAQAMDLIEALSLARGHDVRLQIAAAELNARAERVPAARAALLPSLAAQAGVQAGRFDSGSGTNPRYDNYSAGLSLGIPLYRPASWVAVDQADMALVQAEVDLNRAGQDLVGRVATAYLDVLAALDTVEAVVAQRRAIHRQYELARRNYEVGSATIIDQQEARARLDLNLAQLAVARNTLAVRRALLAQLTGRADETLHGLPDEVVLPAIAPDDLEVWKDRARQASHAVRLAEQSVAIADAEVRRAGYAHQPVVELTSQAQRIHGKTATTVNWPGDRTTSLAIGIQLTLPIYNGGGLSARQREAVASLGRSQGELELARRQAEQTVREAYYAWHSSGEQVRALAAAVRSSELALESNRVGYRVGARINVDVLNAQQQVFEAFRDHARARYDVLLNGLKLKSAAGALSEEDLREVNALLAPRANRTFSSAGVPVEGLPAPEGAEAALPAVPIGGGRRR